MMGLDIEKYTETYVDLPLSNFPIKEDDWNRMSDVSASLMSLVQEYNQLYAEGKYTEAKQLIDNNEELLNCFFNADKYNQLRDAIIAVQRFMLNEVVELIKEVSKNTVGIEDQPTSEQKELTTYSSKKIELLLSETEQAFLTKLQTEIDNLENKYFMKKNVLIPLDGWNDEFPYYNTVSVDGVTSDMDMRIIGTVISDSMQYNEIKKIVKSVGFLLTNENGIGDNTITFRAYKKPVSDVTVIMEGGC